MNFIRFLVFTLMIIIAWIELRKFVYILIGETPVLLEVEPLFDFVLEKGIDKYSIPINNLTPGIYLVKINSGNQLFSRVFVKQQ